ncbi:cytochrome P450 [Novosphingobium resinovorum]
MVDELLRYIGMAKGMLRIAREDFEWHGHTIRKGDFVYGMNISANRDPRMWQRPDEIDPNRDNNRSMAFGPGMHFCLGHLLAKMELAEFFTELFGSYDVAILSAERPWINSFTFRGWMSCRCGSAGNSHIPRHCERSEATQGSIIPPWVASLRSQ